MERRFSPLAVVLLWMAFNTVLAGVLAGFVASGHQTGMIGVVYYFGFMSVIAGIAAALWLVRRRQPLERGLRIPARPAAVVLLAAGVTLVCLGLAFGAWLPMLGAVLLVAALILEVSARRHRPGS
jgi:hypothetical protein